MQNFSNKDSEKQKKLWSPKYLFIVYFNESTKLRRKNKDMTKEKRAGKRELKMLQEKKKREIKREMISPDLLRANSIPKTIKDFLPTSYNTLSIWREKKQIQNFDKK